MISTLKHALTLRWITGRRFVISVPFAWLAATFLLPFLIVARISFSETDGENPFGNLMTYADGVFNLKVKIANYLFIASDDLYVLTYLSSIKFALITTLCCLLIGYPFAYFMARAKSTVRPVLLMMVMLPFWTSFLLRIYAWKGILANQGIVNHLLLSLGWISEPLHLMNTQFSLLIGMVYAYLPFMILPLQAFWRITVPLSKSGIIAGSMLVFIPAVGEYVIPELLGGPETLMIGHVLWDEFFTNNDWPMASSVAVVVILLILVPMAILNKYQAEQREGGRA